MKTLYLLRHAKSSWDDAGLADHDRPLAPRGRRATKLLAKHLPRASIEPELVLCSSARRARETLEGIAPALGDAVELRGEQELYGATSDELIERLRAVPDSVASVMLIGHNPAVQELALAVAAGGGELGGIAQKYPTGGLATVAFSGSWRDLGPGTAELVGFVRPKDLG